MIQNLSKNLVDLGLEVPAPIRAVEDLRHALMTAANSEASNLDEVILDGSATAANVGKKLQAAALARVTQRAALEIARELDGTFDKAHARTVRNSAPEILTALRGPFDQAAASLKISVEALGPNPDQQAILKAGPVAMANWEARKQAKALMDSVRAIRVALANARWGPRQQGPEWYIAGARNTAHLDVARQAFNNGGLAALIEAGFEPHLNDLDEIENVKAGAHAVTTAEEAARREEATEAARVKGQREVNNWEKLFRQPPRPDATPNSTTALDVELLTDRIRKKGKADAAV